MGNILYFYNFSDSTDLEKGTNVFIQNLKSYYILGNFLYIYYLMFIRNIFCDYNIQYIMLFIQNVFIIVVKTC